MIDKSESLGTSNNFSYYIDKVLFDSNRRFIIESIVRCNPVNVNLRKYGVSCVGSCNSCKVNQIMNLIKGMK